MKKKLGYAYLMIIIMVLICLQSCKKTSVNISDKCIPGKIIFFPILTGENNHIKLPLLIRTNENDSSYMEFNLYGERETSVNGRIDRFPIYIENVSADQYLQIKNYLLSDTAIQQVSDVTFKKDVIRIVLEDNCDTFDLQIGKGDSYVIPGLVKLLNKDKNKDEVLIRDLKEFWRSF